MNIVVHYNVERGFDEAALMLARRLFAEFDEAIESLALIPVTDEDLDLHLNGRLVHSASRSGRLPRVADVLAIPEAAEWARMRTVGDAVSNDAGGSPDDDRPLPEHRERDEPG
jgi:hypothetical protein